MLRGISCALVTILAAGAPALSQSLSPYAPVADFRVYQQADGTILAADATGEFQFVDWGQYFNSPFFRRNGARCGHRSLPAVSGGTFLGGTSDCTDNSTSIEAGYEPSVVTYRIPCVVHVLQATNGDGFISDAMVQSQIDVLNEDFNALAGTNGAPGADCNIEFFLATEDPSGNPTSGIDRHTNNSWYNDSGNYQSAINWDTEEYFNIYTNTASGYLGYAYLPTGGGVVGEYFDGIVCHWEAFGRNSPFFPYHLGRTATHEAGHYFGLFHTFDGSCDSGSCYTDGDLVCDTNDESGPNFGCNDGNISCSSVDPVHNYMDYSDDSCMWEFTAEQCNRMRCVLETWRVALPDVDFSLSGVPGVVNVGDTVTMTTRGGIPGNLAMMFVTAINSFPFFRPVTSGVLDSNGRWILAGGVPNEPNLPGNTLSLGVFSTDEGGMLALTNNADVTVN
jgi:hypothetical protein